MVVASGALLACAAEGGNEPSTTGNSSGGSSAQGAGGSGAQGGSGASGGSLAQSGPGGQGGDATGGTGGDATGGAGGSGGSGQEDDSDVVPELLQNDLSVNCPVVTPLDPIVGSFAAEYTNNGTDPGSAVITGASLVFDGTQGILKWNFVVTPNNSGLVAAMSGATIEHNKTASSSNGTPCSYCNGSGMWTLQVTWDVNGASVTESLGPTDVSCIVP